MHTGFRTAAALAGILSFALVAAAGQPVAAAPADGPSFTCPTTDDIAPDHVLVRFAPGTGNAQVNAANMKAGVLEVLFTYDPLVPDLYCVRVPTGTVQQAIASYAASGLVQYAEVDFLQYALVQTTPYGVTMVNAPAAWSAAGQGLGARVADLDTGVDMTHPDLPRPVLTQSFIPGETVDDFNTHGTHTSGTILALDNTDGVVGVAPRASLMMGKVLGNGGSGSTAGVLAGVNWAVANNAKVISMSLGGGGFEQSFQDGVTAAVAANVLVVAAAGNANSSAPFYPAWYSGVVSVAAVDVNGVRASFSNYGPTVSVCAPGVNVPSTVPVIAGAAVWTSVSHFAQELDGSAVGSASGNAIYCGVGAVASDFPASVAGNIAHIRRGPDGAGNPVTFQTKVYNALSAGAVGVIVSNNSAGLFTGTLNTSVNVPVLGISQADGDDLQAHSGVPTTVSIAMTGHSYANFSGTSMACPHVAGVAGLIIGNLLPRTVPVALLRQALENTATDLGDAGRDDLFGHGLVNAAAAQAYVLAHLSGCGTADFNHDGDVGTDQDIEAFFACLAGTCCPTCGSADFNGDGDVGTDQDIEAFFRVLSGGTC